MPQTIPVTLNYTKDAAGCTRVVQPDTIKVGQGDKIQFVRGSIPDGMNFFIKFQEHQFFSSETVDEGAGPVEVTQNLPKRTKYSCGLKRNGQVVEGSVSGPADADPGGAGGGDIEPSSGN
jgi:hypothetical protein